MDGIISWSFGFGFVYVRAWLLIYFYVGIPPLVMFVIWVFEWNDMIEA